MSKINKKNGLGLMASLMVASAVMVPSAMADGFDFKGSFGEAGGFKRYVPAVSNPLFNETPFITTEARALYLHNDIPKGFPSQGGEIDLGAVELRLALTDRLGLIAAKDGVAGIHFNKAIKDTTGFANISLGLKYALFVDQPNNAIVSVAAVYEPPIGSLQTSGIKLQGGGGGGFVDLFTTAARTFGKLGIQGSVGTNLALDTKFNSSIVHYAAHVDYEIAPDLFPLVEVNGFSVIDSGKRLPLNFEGVDLVNFGSTQGGTVVTAAFGARYRINDSIQVGVAYERPLTNREDILSQRVYFDAIFKY